MKTKRYITPLLVLMAWMLSVPAMADPTETKARGDVNGDKKVTIADITAMVSIIKGQDNATPFKFDHDAADLNKDGHVDDKDIRILAKIILTPKSGVEVGDDTDITVNPGEEHDPGDALTKKKTIDWDLE